MVWKIVMPGAVVLGSTLGLGTLGCFWPSGDRDRVLSLPGVVETQEVRLGSKVGGRVERVAIEEGDVPRAGQTLVVLEAPELVARRDQLVARLHAAEATLEKARNGPRAEE